MGIPEQPQSGMNIAPDGMVYEILEDGTIKRIGKVSPDGKFEPFGGTKDGIREKDGIIYRVINGKERKIGRILPNGEIETINQRIRNEAEVSRNKVKAATIVSVCSLLAFFVALYAMQQVWKTREYDYKVKPVYSMYLDEVTPTSESLQGYINQLDKLIKLKEVKYTENKRKIAEIIDEIKAKQSKVVAKQKEQEAKEQEEARKKAAKEEADRQARLKAASKAEQNEYKTNIKPLYDAYEKEKNPNSDKLQSYITKLNNLIPKLKYENNKQTVKEMVDAITTRKGSVKADEDQKKQAEAKKAEEERKAKEAEAKKAEEERKKQEADAKKAEEARKAEEPKAKKAEEEQKKKEAEAKMAEAARKKRENEKRKELVNRTIGNRMWSKLSSKKMTWNIAKNHCRNLQEGGYRDWRLPNIDELRMLLIADRVAANCKVSEANNCLSINCWSCLTCTQALWTKDKYCSWTAYDDGRYSKLGDSFVYLWSSSKVTVSSNTTAWIVDYSSGKVEYASDLSSKLDVRCVRDAK